MMACQGHQMSRTGESINTDIDLASLCKNKYPVFPPFDVLSANFGTEARSFREFTYGYFSPGVITPESQRAHLLPQGVRHTSDRSRTR